MPRSTALALTAILTAAPAFGAESTRAPAFNADVRPIFQAYCTECHGEAEKPKGNLDLRLRHFAIKGGKSGPAVVEGKPDASLLIERVTNGEMPPGKKKLNSTEIKILRKWVATGAKVETSEPETLAAGFPITESDRRWWAFQPVKRPAVPTTVNAQSLIRNPIDAFLLAKLSERGLSFNPPTDRVTLIRRVTFDLIGLPPSPTEVDAFVKDNSPDAYEKLVERLLTSPQYGERWGRHWLDVAGYADSEGGSPQDTERVWAWKYRDYVIRAFNADKPFNRFVKEQLAGDEMVKPPFAELKDDDLDALTATGFLRMAPDGSGVSGVDQKLARNAVLTDTVKITASAFLGLTVGCAQCHNHRYDPIPQTDFFRLRAAFEPGYDTTAWKMPAARRVSLYTVADKKKAAEIEVEAAKIDKQRLKKQEEFIAATFDKEVAKLPKEMQAAARAARKAPAAKRTAAQKKLMREHPSLNVSAGSLYLYDSKAAAELKKLSAAAAEVRKKKPTEEFVRALTEVPGRLPTTFLHHRGDPDQPKQAVAPGGLAVLDTALPLNLSKKLPPSGSSGRRLALANWLTNPRHPLTARVMVNRIWMLHFGRGIVGTPGDFGRLGERPTHPELLDWLASEFVTPTIHVAREQDSLDAWSIKHIHRLILTSTAYRQSSARDAAKDAADADNKLLGRFALRRLDAEAVRDATLATSGKLNLKQFGPPVPVMEDDAGLIVIGKANRDGAQYKLGDESVAPGEESRRSVYVQVRRSKPLAILGTFDGATAEPNCESRVSTTGTPQSLMLLNGEFSIAQGQAFAARVRKEAGAEQEAQIRRTWELAYLRTPSEKERSDALRFLRAATEAFRKQPIPPAPPKKKGAKTPAAKPQASPEERALAAFCQAILTSNRFLYVE